MARPERYFIGPNVRSKLTDLFTRVDGMPVGGGQGEKIPVALQDMRRPSHGTSIRAGTFTGAWNVGASKVVTLTAEPTATVTVTNISWPITHNHTSPEDCLVGKEGDQWWLVVPALQTATAALVFQSNTAAVVTDVSISAILNTSNCAISITKTVTTASVTVISQTATAQYVRLRVP